MPQTSTSLRTMTRNASSYRISVKPTVAIAASGFVIFAITGLLGYLYCTGSVDRAGCPYLLSFSLDFPFLKSWLLFGWLCALVFTLQHAMLGQGPVTAKRRRERQWTYAVTGLCIVIVAIVDLTHFDVFNALTQLIDNFLQFLINTHGLFFRLISDPWFYTVLNFGVILALGLGTLRRVRRLEVERARYEASGGPDDPRLKRLPEVYELAIGDLLVRSTIVLLLWLVLKLIGDFNLLGRVVPGTIVPPKDVACSLSLPGHCSTTLSFLDLLIALLGLAAGVALAAIVSQALTQEKARNQATAAAMAGEQAPAAQTKPANADGMDVPALTTLGGEVADTLLDILLRPFQRMGAAGEGEDVAAYDPLAIARVILWPSLILIGVVGTAFLARETQHALHRVTDVTIPGVDVLFLKGFPSQRLVDELLAVVSGVVALAGIILAAGMVTRDRQVSRNGLEFLRVNGFITLLLFCVYSFAFWLIQVFLRTIPLPSVPPERLNAFSPGYLTVASTALLLWFGLPNLWKRLGINKSRPKPA